MPRRVPKPPSQKWRTFLKNHMMNMVSIDFFPVPTATFRIFFVLLILSHSRRRVVHFNLTSHPTTNWTAQQIIEAFPWDTAPKYLLRDRDGIYGVIFRQRLKNMVINEVVTAPRSPWQNPFVERLIGSIRRDCLDHVIVLNESHLKRMLTCHRCRMGCVWPPFSTVRAAWNCCQIRLPIRWLCCKTWHPM